MEVLVRPADERYDEETLAEARRSIETCVSQFQLVHGEVTPSLFAWVNA